MSIEWTNLILENNSGATLLIDDLGLELENNEQINLSDSLSFAELCESNDLRTLLDNNSVRLSTNGGSTWLTANEAKEVLTRIHQRYLIENYYNRTEIDNRFTSQENDINDLQTEVDNIETSVGLTSAGNLEQISGSNYLDSITNIKQGLLTLDSQVKTNENEIDTKVNRAGDTMTGDLHMGNNEVFSTVSEPSDGTSLPNWNFIKSRIDAVAAGYDPKESVRVATTDNLDATYTAGSSVSGYPGVGATLESNTNGVLIVDGVTLNQGDRVLVWKQNDAKQNGIYVVTETGDASTPWKLTRAEDFDGSPDGEVSGGAHTYAETGNDHAGDEFVVIHDGNVIVGTDDINFTISGGSGAITDLQAEVDRIEAGAGLDTDGNYIVDTTGHYISAATSIHNATQLLDDQVFANYQQIVQNAQDIADLQNTDISNIKVIDGRVYGKDSVRNRWVGPEETLIFTKNGRIRRGFLKIDDISCNNTSYRAERDLIIHSISVQLLNPASTTFEIRNQSGVLGTFQLNSANGGQDTSLNLSISQGDRILIKVAGGDIIRKPVVKLGIAYDGGSL